ncbi:MAG: DUF4129 domain-containing protein [Thermoplasmata archaeon]
MVWKKLPMDLDFDRKEIFIIGVVILLIVAWLIGNLSGAYFGMQDEEMNREPERLDHEGSGKALHIPDFVGDILFFTVILGLGAWFLFSEDGWKSKSIRGGAFLIVISVIYFSDYILSPFFSALSGFKSVLPDIEYPTIQDIGLGDVSRSTSSSIGPSIGILILLASTLVVVFFLIRQKKLSEQDPQTEEDISSTADKAITELHEGEEVRDVIIRNYQKMLIILEREGVKQKISFTPRELENIALDRLPLKKETIEEMTKLFEEAKYSHHPLGEKDRERALANFKQIRDELGDMKDG